MELPEAEEVVEHLGLDDLGRLRHPDPLGQPGQLHRGRHGDEVALALRERFVDRHEAVFRGVGLVGDLGRGRVGQPLGGADQDRARVELEQACALDIRREPADEPDVARPEQALLGRAAGLGEESHGGMMHLSAVRWGPADRTGADGPKVRARRGRSRGLVRRCVRRPGSGDRGGSPVGPAGRPSADRRRTTAGTRS